MNPHLAHFAKFFTGSLVGAILDFFVASIVILFGFSMIIASCSGFLTAVFLTYIIHLRWTFALSKQEQIFSHRMLKFLMFSAFTLAVRLIFIYIAQYFLTMQNSFIELSIVFSAIIISFCLNYFLSKYITFKKYSA